MVGIAERLITHKKCDKYGNITHICNPKSSWKEISVENAISHISSMMYKYYLEHNGVKVTVKVGKNLEGKKILKSDSEDNKVALLPTMY